MYIAANSMPNFSMVDDAVKSRTLAISLKAKFVGDDAERESYLSEMGDLRPQMEKCVYTRDPQLMFKLKNTPKYQRGGLAFLLRKYAEFKVAGGRLPPLPAAFTNKVLQATAVSWWQVLNDHYLVTGSRQDRVNKKDVRKVLADAGVSSVAGNTKFGQTWAEWFERESRIGEVKKNTDIFVWGVTRVVLLTRQTRF